MKGMRIASRQGLAPVTTEYVAGVYMWKPMAVGMWAWLLHRVTGIALAAYLLLHISLMSIALLKGERAFDSLLNTLMTSRPVRLLDLGLLAAVLIHGINGIRLILLDLGVGVRRQKETFWGGMVIAAILFFWSALRVLPEIMR